MLSEILSHWNHLIGAGSDQPGVVAVAMRAVVIYFATLAMIRWGDKRFMGKNTAFDVIVGVVLGSVVSRAINGSADLLPTIAGGFVFVGLHWLLADLAFRSDWIGDLMKGSTRILVKDGQIDWHQMRHSHMSTDDLLGRLRAQGSIDGWHDVKEARLERSGDVSVVKKSRSPEILCANVEGSDLVVRIRIE